MPVETYFNTERHDRSHRMAPAPIYSSHLSCDPCMISTLGSRSKITTTRAYAHRERPVAPSPTKQTLITLPHNIDFLTTMIYAETFSFEKYFVLPRTDTRLIWRYKDATQPQLLVIRPTYRARSFRTRKREGEHAQTQRRMNLRRPPKVYQNDTSPKDDNFQRKKIWNGKAAILVDHASAPLPFSSHRERGCCRRILDRIDALLYSAFLRKRDQFPPPFFS